MAWRFVVILVFLTLHGCAKPPQRNVAIPEHKPAPPVRVAKKLTPPHVIILVSENIPAYSDVARELGRLLGKRASIQYLSSSLMENMKAINTLKNEDNVQIVSIGLNAAVAANTLTNHQVIFCQVYNFQDYALLSPNHKGVSMMTSFSKTFSTWRTLSINAIDIGVISGPGFEEVMQTAKSAALSQGFRLHHETVNSDKEYLYTFKKMSKQVQGYWLLPDNRVLSENILRDLMTFSVRNSKQVAVFSDELLKLGGLFSIQSNNKDIAQQVFDRLDQAQFQDTIPGPDIVYPEKLELLINSVMAKHLDVTIPKKFRKYANAP
jgi:ABC-type uncharacterized transport system substrate-binding protein